MTALIFNWSLGVAQVLLALAMMFALARIVIGPNAQDRILALDAIYMNAVMLLLCFGIRSGTTLYFEAALTIALLGFVTTVAMAKFLMRGEVIE